MESLTFGQHMLRDILPSDVYQSGTPLNKKSIREVLGEVAKRYPEKYEEISYRLMRLGLSSGESQGGASFGMQDLSTARAANIRRKLIAGKMKEILDGSQGSDRRKRISDLLVPEASKQVSEILAESKADGNRFALQLEGAGRGNPGSLAGLRGGPVVLQDAAGEPVPIPVTRSYSQGLTPMQYLASTYGARRGLVGTKLSVASSGFLAKVLSQATHRLPVVDVDDPEPVGRMRGLLVDTDDDDNIGALLAQDYGDIPKDTVITSKIQARLVKGGNSRLLVRSPLSSSSLDGGVYAKDLGLHEYGRLPLVGEHVGQVAAHAIGEQLTQASLGQKHVAGALGRKSSTPGLSGFELAEKLVNPSEMVRGLAAHSEADGRVDSIDEAPQGGWLVSIGGKQNYVPADFTVTAKVGQTVEAGDQITDGIPNPAAITRLKGIGEGRSYFVQAMRRGLNEAGFPVNRRQLELLSRGLIDRVRVTEEFDEFTPDSVVPYSRVEKLYRPREDSEELPVIKSAGRYLEEPVLHYSIGTRITPSVQKTLDEVKLERVRSHKAPPPFIPEVTRGMDVLQTDPDWMTRFLGSNLQKGFLNAVQFGAESDEYGTSFVPSRARAVNLARVPLQQSQSS